MIGKLIKTRSDMSATSTFTARINYCCRKAVAVSVGNLNGDWHDAAAHMAVTAGLNPALRDPSLHMVLSWGDGERPQNHQIIAAARMVITEMGAEWHQYVIAVHHDRQNLHGHIVLNLVHPVTGAALSLRHDYARLELACRKAERHFEWPPDRGRFDQKLVDAEVRLAPKPQHHWDAKRAERAAGVRSDPRGVRGASQRTGRKPLRDRLSAELRRAARGVIRSATDWLDLQAGLRSLGLGYHPFGSGARIVEIGSGDRMPASHLGSDYSFGRLVQRLGCYMSAPASASVAQSPQSPSRKRDRHSRQPGIDERASLHDAHQRERQKLSDAVRGLPRLVAASFRQVLRDDQKDQLKQLRKGVSTPQMPNHGIDSTGTRTAPVQEWALRYRHRVRLAGAQRDGFLLKQLTLDHTRLRQIWHAAFRDETGALRLPDAQELDADLRAFGKRYAMTPRRGIHGGIIGYDLVDEHPDHSFVTIGTGPQYGVAMIGSREARACLIAADAAMGMTVSAARPKDLVIITPRTVTARTVAQILAIIGSRPTSIIVESSYPQSDLFAQLRSALPQIKVINPSEKPDRTASEVTDNEPIDPPAASHSFDV